jgi:Xaa-Pro dipeptidase
MDLRQRLDTLRSEMKDQGIDLVLGFHDNAHYIEKPNPVIMLSGFKSLGDTALVLHRDGESTLIVTPSWDAERAQETAPAMRVVATQDLVASVSECVQRYGVPPERIGVAGLAAMPRRVETGVRDALRGVVRAVDAMVARHARRKTADEIAHAKTATRIAERGYERLLKLARPGMREDELATDLRWYMKSLGAEDNFLMLTSGSHKMAVQTSSGRRFEPGDLILAELTPSCQGQMAQLCRTAVMGPASELRKEKYALVVSAMKEGIKLAMPGNPMSKVCNAINAVLEAQGYGQYCHPPHIKRRGHGLGFGSLMPGDVAPDNDTVLEPDMFFIIHPNQYLPETGYMMCGEPMLITEQGSQQLTERMAALAEIQI